MKRRDLLRAGVALSALTSVSPETLANPKRKNQRQARRRKARRRVGRSSICRERSGWSGTV